MKNSNDTSWDLTSYLLICATAFPLANVVVLNYVNNTTQHILIFGWGGGKNHPNLWYVVPE